MSQRTDVGNIMKAIDTLLSTFTIAGMLPSYLIRVYILSTALISPSVRGALGAVQQIENASQNAMRRRKEEVEEKKDDKQDMLRKMLDIAADRGEEVNFAYPHICVEAYSSM